MSARVRGYLFFGSFVGVAVAAVGLASLLTAAITFVTGTPFGGIPVEAAIRTGEQQALQRDQDLVRGATFAAFGIAFWLGHAVAHGRARRADDGTGRRVHLLGQTLAGGLVALGIRLLFMRQLPGDRPRRGRAVIGWRGGGGGPPLEAAGVGARIRPGPASRSAGAEAVPPRDVDPHVEKVRGS